jgi:cytochrome c556
VLLVFLSLSFIWHNRVVKIPLWFLIGLLLISTSACTQRQPAEPELVKTATIKDIMDSMVDPSAEFLFDSVAQIADENGIREKAPQTDEEWKEVRRRAIVLLEAPNLLLMNGRKVARPGEKAENPSVELQPEQIQALLDSDRVSFINRARALQEAATLVLNAADAKNKDALFDACTHLDKACEGCHIHYWYPNDKRAVESATQD